MIVEPGGSLFAPTLLFSIDAFETVTISGAGAGGRLELGNLTVGGLVSGNKLHDDPGLRQCQPDRS